MAFTPASQRPPYREKFRLTGALPTHSSIDEEKYSLTSRHPGASWTTSFRIPDPRGTGRSFSVTLPIPPRLARLVHRKVWGAFFLLLFIIWLLLPSRRSGRWPGPLRTEKATLVFGPDELHRIWQWEIASGHYPSSRPFPKAIDFLRPLSNPGLPSTQIHSYVNVSTVGIGSLRQYSEIQINGTNKPVAYPPRPTPGTIADLDVVMKHCDFTTNQYVRDCLEVLRIGSGLDNGNRVRRGKMDSWKYIYSEEKRATDKPVSWTNPPSIVPSTLIDDPSRREGHEPALQLRQPQPVQPYSTLPAPCDPDHPRIFHMFWAGPFTDKPYMALISFLFTQNLGLDKPLGEAPPPGVCRPQFWMWVNPGPASVMPPSTALQDMYDLIGESPWSAPFLHPRFKDVIKFKLWNTTEQLDSIHEIKDEWRHLKGNILNSGGWKYAMKTEAESKSTSVSEATEPVLSIPLGNGTAGPIPLAHEPTGKPKSGTKKDKYEGLGSTTQEDYDAQGKLSVVLSDMARFILCHRYGGTYLDADTILLRDWEELWGWKGAFAYRWSRLEKFNTAVLRMNKGSALGSWLFRTALRNGLDFHPMTVSVYTKDADLDGLFLRLPDALFDPAWLNTEWYQRDRPPFPYFQSFDDLFRSPQTEAAGPQAIGFDGFFRGAFSYHWHNHWWEPFDPARNFADLGPRFIKNERKARAKLHAESIASAASAASAAARSARPGRENRKGWNILKNKDKKGPITGVPGAEPSPTPTPHGLDENYEHDDVSMDWRDLSWATVLKRTFEAHIRGERPNMYGEWIHW